MCAGIDLASFPRPTGDAAEAAVAAPTPLFPANAHPRYLRLTCNAIPAQQVSSAFPSSPLSGCGVIVLAIMFLAPCCCGGGSLAGCGSAPDVMFKLPVSCLLYSSEVRRHQCAGQPLSHSSCRKGQQIRCCLHNATKAISILKQAEMLLSLIQAVPRGKAMLLCRIPAFTSCACKNVWQTQIAAGCEGKVPAASGSDCPPLCRAPCRLPPASSATGELRHHQVSAVPHLHQPLHAMVRGWQVGKHTPPTACSPSIPTHCTASHFKKALYEK